jgi:hypothetical protein
MKKGRVKGQQNNHPFTRTIQPSVPEYIAPTGFAASIGKFLGSLSKPKS